MKEPGQPSNVIVDEGGVPTASLADAARVLAAGHPKALPVPVHNGCLTPDQRERTVGLSRQSPDSFNPDPKWDRSAEWHK